MKTYQIQVRSSIPCDATATVIVEAKNEDDAKAKVKAMYDADEIKFEQLKFYYDSAKMFIEFISEINEDDLPDSARAHFLGDKMTNDGMTAEQAEEAWEQYRESQDHTGEE